jgi:hypothetical protein
MTSTTLRAANGSPIAIMEDDSRQVKIRTMTGSYKGYYDKSSDKTYQANGNFVGYGNLLMTLV